jgi:hypothetical protein
MFSISYRDLVLMLHDRGVALDWLKCEFATTLS